MAQDVAIEPPRAEGSGRTTMQRVFRVLARPLLLCRLVNAQMRLRGARVPVSVALLGHAWAGGGGSIILGDRVLIRGTMAPVELLARPGGRIEIGEGTFINYGVSITAYDSVSIGRDCQIGHYAFIYDNDEHDVHDKFSLPPSQPVVLEDRVWLGTRVTVLKGVRIGHDAVIGAGSVVTKDIPPRSIAAGVPARVLRRF
jgi:UDP-3-O-[3-hydroxymyristoyl] glucosamine N-acyltransferase